MTKAVNTGSSRYRIPVIALGLIAVGGCSWFFWNKAQQNAAWKQIVTLKERGDADLQIAQADKRTMSSKAESAAHAYAEALSTAHNRGWTNADDEAGILQKVRQQKTLADQLVVEQRARAQATSARQFLEGSSGFIQANRAFIERYSQSTVSSAMARLGPDQAVQAIRDRTDMITAFIVVAGKADVVAKAADRIPADAPDVRTFVDVVKARAQEMAGLKKEFPDAARALMRAESGVLSGTTGMTSGQATVADYEALLKRVVSASSEASGTLQKIQALANQK